MGTNRRDFLKTLTSSSAALAASSWLQPLGYAQARGTARTVINAARHKGEIDRRVLGAFLVFVSSGEDLAMMPESTGEMRTAVRLAGCTFRFTSSRPDNQAQNSRTSSCGLSGRRG
jgi:hypothetical protein